MKIVVPIKKVPVKRRGRPTLGDKPMTPYERLKKHRQSKKEK